MRPVEVLLHPLRFRIVRAFLGGRARTTAALRDELGDVPPATLYRQIAALVDGDVLEVVEERRIRRGGRADTPAAGSSGVTGW